MNAFTYQETIPKWDVFDVIVCGGGLSGIAAALSAARRGKKVLLLEKQCVLGGLATTGLVNYWVPLCNGRGKYIIKGMAQEFLQLSVKYGFDTFYPDWKDGEPDHPTRQRSDSWFSGGIFALALLKLLKDAGVEILYDALVSVPIMEGNHCKGVIIDGKSGRRFYGCKVLVDATGDATVLSQAGVPTVDGTNYFTYYGEGITLDGCRKAVEKKDIFLAYYHPYGGAANLHGGFHPKGKPLYQGVTMEVINEYLQENQLLMLEKEKDKPRTSRNIHMLPAMPQLRTARRIDADEVLKGEDCYHHSETSIGTICDFEHRDRLYEVPYGTLVKTGFNNLITCGRSAAGEGWGWEVLRVIPPAVLTGQAAGIAASMAIEEGCPIPEVPIAALQQALSETGVIIRFEDAWVPKEEHTDTHADLADHI